MKKSLKGIIVGLVAMFAFAPVVFADTVTVTFDTKGGSTIDPVEVEDMSHLTLPENPTKDGFVFGGWTTDEDGEVNFNAEWDSIMGDTTLYAKWVTEDKIIKNVNIKVNLPEAGTEYVNEENPSPDIVLDDNANYTVEWTMFINNYPSQDPSYDDISRLVGTKFEDGKDYYIEVFLRAKEGYLFASDVILKVNNGTDYEISEYGDNQNFAFFAKVNSETTIEESKEETATEEATKTTYEVLNGADQKYDATSDDRLTFRFSIDYAEFQKSGKVYMDGALIDPSNYETKEGSTIVIFTKAYTNLLKAGNHTMKVTTDNGEVSTNFTVTKSVKNPQTGDNIYTYVISSIIALAALAGMALNKKKLYD